MSPDVVSETWTSPVPSASGETCLSETLPAKQLVWLVQVLYKTTILRRDSTHFSKKSNTVKY